MLCPEVVTGVVPASVNNVFCCDASSQRAAPVTGRVAEYFLAFLIIFAIIRSFDLL
jgi:hypothetical protein